MGRPFYAVIIPLGEGGHPDQGLPGGGYYPDQGLPGSPPGIWPRPPGGGEHPGQGLPGGGEHPDHGFNPDYPDQGLPGGEYPDQGGPGGGYPGRPGNRPPGSYPGRPGNRPPGSGPGRPVDPGFGWGGGERPGQGLPPDLGLPIGPAHPWEPPAGQELPPPPEEIADSVIVAVWRPNDQVWKVAIADTQGPQPGRPPQNGHPQN